MNNIFDNSGLDLSLRSDLVKANVNNQLEGMPLLTEKSLQKAVEEMDLLVYEEGYINSLKADLVKGFNTDKTISEESFEKAKKDLGKLIKTVVLDKNGVRRIVYVARKEYKSHTEGNKAEIEATIARQKALLNNPKSPASARKRAEEILKVEQAKLGKIDSDNKGTSADEDKIYARKISQDAHNLTNNTKYDDSIADHEKAANKHREAAKALRNVGIVDREANVHDREAEHHDRMISEKKRPQITYRRVSTNEPNISGQKVSHEIYVDGKFRGRHADVLTAKELIDQLVEEGGVFDPNVTTEDILSKKDVDLSFQEKSILRLVNGISQIGEVSSSRILSTIRGDIEYRRWKGPNGRMVGQHNSQLKKMFNSLEELDVDGALKSYSEISPSYREKIIPAINFFMRGDPDFPKEGKHSRNLRPGDGNLTPNGREKRKEKVDGEKEKKIDYPSDLKIDLPWKQDKKTNEFKVTNSGVDFNFNSKTGDLKMIDGDDSSKYQKKVKDTDEADEIIGRLLDGGDEDGDWEPENKLKTETWSDPNKRGIEIQSGGKIMSIVGYTNGQGPDHIGMMTGLKKNESFVFSDDGEKYRITSLNGKNRYNVQQLSLLGNVKDDGLSGNFEYKEPKPKVSDRKVDKALDKLKRGGKLQKGDIIISFDLSNDLEKAHKDLSKLIKTTVMDKNGHRRTVYISRKEYESHTKDNKAEIEATIKRQESLLANPKSPVSAKNKAKEILKTEKAKLAKMGGGSFGPKKTIESEGQRAKSLSEEAHSESGRTPEAHKAAAEAHSSVAKLHREAGNDDYAKEHEKKAELHTKWAELKKESDTKVDKNKLAAQTMIEATRLHKRGHAILSDIWSGRNQSVINDVAGNHIDAPTVMKIIDLAEKLDKKLPEGEKIGTSLQSLKSEVQEKFLDKNLSKKVKEEPTGNFGHSPEDVKRALGGSRAMVRFNPDQSIGITLAVKTAEKDKKALEDAGYKLQPTGGWGENSFRISKPSDF